MVDLMAYAQPQFDVLPRQPRGEGSVLNTRALRRPPEELRSGGLTLSVRQAGRDYGNVRRDVLVLAGERPDFRALGVATFASLFYEQPIVVECDGPERSFDGPLRLRRFVINGGLADYRLPPPDRLVSRPMGYAYWPRPSLPQHPFHDFDGPDHELPTLVWPSDGVRIGFREDDWDPRTLVEGFGHAPEPAARMAALLLDIGHPGATRTEYVLEGPPGIPGVSAFSAELRLLVGDDPYA